MKKIIIPLLFATSAIAQQPDVNWIVSAGGPGQESLKAISNPSGNVLIGAGFFSGTLNIGNNIAVSAAGGTDVFIVKYADGNTVSWVKTFGNACHEQVASVATDAAGNIYVTGSFYNALSVDNTTIYSAGSKDAFLASFDINGNLNWLQAFGGAGTDEGADLAVDPAGYIYLAANMNQADFTITEQPSTGGSAHVAKFDFTGNLLWSVCESGNAQSAIRVNSIAVDETGFVFATGFYFGQVLAGNNASTLLQSASENVWAGGYDQNGNTQFIFTLQQPAVNSNHGTSIAVTPSGNAVLCAYHTGSLIFNGSVYQSTDRDVLVLELSQAGVLTWGTVIESPGLQSPTAIAVNENGLTAIGGLFIGDLAIGSTTLPNPAGADGFLLLLNQNVVSGMLQYSGSGNEIVHTLVAHEDGFISGGDFSGGTTASMNVGMQSVNSAGDLDYFISKISPPATTSISGNYHNNEHLSVEAYPNPASDRVKFRYAVKSDDVLVTLFALSGAKAGSFHAAPGNGGLISLDLSSISPGAYHVQILDGNNVVNSRIIVQ